MDKPPTPVLRDYRPSVEAGTTWVTCSPVTAVLTLDPREDHLYVENIAVDPSAQGRGLGRALMESAEQREGGPRMGQQRLAGRGQGDRAPVAVQQPLAELGLQAPDLLADRGLGDPQPFRCAGEVSLLGDGGEVRQLP